ncbi:hypothetical protein V5799_029438, partial [Amblyomma americanum]
MFTALRMFQVLSHWPPACTWCRLDLPPSDDHTAAARNFGPNATHSTLETPFSTLIAVPIWQPPLPDTSSTTGLKATLLNQQNHPVHSGHDTGRRTMLTALLMFQVLSHWPPACTWCRLDLPPSDDHTAAAWKFGPNAAHSTFETPFSTIIAVPIWQPPQPDTSSTTGLNATLLNQQNHPVHSGHDTGRRTMFTALRMFQVLSHWPPACTWCRLDLPPSDDHTAAARNFGPNATHSTLETPFSTLIAVPIWQPPLPDTSSTTGLKATLLNQQNHPVHSGHDTGRRTMLTALLMFQVLSHWPPACTWCRLDLPPSDDHTAAAWKFGPNAAHSTFETPFSTIIAVPIWQPPLPDTSSTTGLNATLLNQQNHPVHSGHDTGRPHNVHRTADVSAARNFGPNATHSTLETPFSTLIAVPIWQPPLPDTSSTTGLKATLLNQQNHPVHSGHDTGRRTMLTALLMFQVLSHWPPACTWCRLDLPPSDDHTAAAWKFGPNAAHSTFETPFSTIIAVPIWQPPLPDTSSTTGLNATLLNQQNHPVHSGHDTGRRTMVTALLMFQVLSHWPPACTWCRLDLPPSDDHTAAARKFGPNAAHSTLETPFSTIIAVPIWQPPLPDTSSTTGLNATLLNQQNHPVHSGHDTGRRTMVTALLMFQVLSHWPPACTWCRLDLPPSDDHTAAARKFGPNAAHSTLETPFSTIIAVPIWQPPLPDTSSTTGLKATLLNQQNHPVHSGHDTGRRTMLTALLMFQVLSHWPPACTWCRLDLPPSDDHTAAAWKFGPNAAHSTLETPFSTIIAVPIWQPPLPDTSSTTGLKATLLNQQNHPVHSGHDTGRRTMLTALLMFQVLSHWPPACTWCRLDLPPSDDHTAAAWKFGPNAAHSTLETPFSTIIAVPIWQPPLPDTSSTTGLNATLLHQQNHPVHSGHDTGRRTTLTALLMFQ